MTESTRSIREELEARNERLAAELRDRWGPCPDEPATDGAFPTRSDQPPSSADDLHETVFPWAVECAVFDEQGRVLLIQNHYYDHEWQLPGGSGTGEERPAEAGRREVLEETGIECEIDGLLCLQPLEFHFEDCPPFPILLVVFTARLVERVPASEPEDPDNEVTEIGWFEPADVPAGTPHREQLRRHADR